MVSLTILKKLCGAFGPSSAEAETRTAIMKSLGERFRFITTTHGHLIAWDPASGGDRTIVFQAHMDELGFRPRRYRDDGYIELSAASPIPFHASNQRLIFSPNRVMGILEIEQVGDHVRYFLDVGARSKDEAMTMVPSFANGAYLSDFHLTPNFLCSKSFDDRAGCAVIVHTLLEHRLQGNRVVGIFTVREESGDWVMPELGRALAEAELKPDLVINFEVCPGGPTPTDVSPMAILGGGVALVHMDRFYMSDSRLCEAMIELAREKKIAHQAVSERSGGGELGSICAELGVHGYSIVVPGRYMHSPHSVISRIDYEAAIKLSWAIAEDREILTAFSTR